MWSQLLDIFFPQTSLTGVQGSWITEAERKQLRSHVVLQEKCDLQSRGIQHIDCIIAATKYEKNSLIKKAIHTFKYKRVPELGTTLSALITDVIPTKKTSAVLCPVPLHWTRKFQRGFNQSDVLATHLSHSTGLEVAHLLRRIRSTGHQAWRSKEERLDALTNAFRFTHKDIPQTVILIDDLTTTGATLDACAQVLKSEGVQKVEAWVIASA